MSFARSLQYEIYFISRLTSRGHYFVRTAGFYKIHFLSLLTIRGQFLLHQLVIIEDNPDWVVLSKDWFEDNQRFAVGVVNDSFFYPHPS